MELNLSKVLSIKKLLPSLFKFYTFVAFERLKLKLDIFFPYHFDGRCMLYSLWPYS